MGILAAIPSLLTIPEPLRAITGYELQVPPSIQEQLSMLPRRISTAASALRVAATISDATNMAAHLGLGPGTDTESLGFAAARNTVCRLFVQKGPSAVSENRISVVRALHSPSCKACKPPAVRGVP